MKTFAILILAIECLGTGFARDRELWLIASPQDLERVNSSLSRYQQSVMPAFEDLERDARRFLDLPPFTVMDKKAIAPSGDGHDYLSLDSSWWPDPEKVDGKPYIRRDGEANPAAKDSSLYDAERLRLFADAVETLGLVWRYRRQEDCAAKGAELLRAWFLDEKTRMNPHLAYAQAVPGVYDGQEEGIIEGRQFIRVMQAALWLRTSSSWTDVDHAGLVEWFRSYLVWLETSPAGKDERNAESNHGSWYDVQAASVALFIGESEKARDTLNRLRSRWPIQFRPNGEQPIEQSRKNSLHYAVYNLVAHLEGVQLGQQVGLDLWGDPASPLEAAVLRLVPYLTNQEKWPYSQGSALDSDYVMQLVRLAEGFMDQSLSEHEVTSISVDSDNIRSRWRILLPGR